MGSIVLLVLILFTVGWLNNLHDEPLTPETQALLALSPNPYKPEDNIFLAIAGFNAPAGESVIAAGLAQVDYYNQHLDAFVRDLGTEKWRDDLHLKDPRRLEFKGDCTFVNPKVTSVWNTVPPHREQIERLLADNRELYDRYLALHSLRGYHNTARAGPENALFSTLGDVSSARKLFLAETVLQLRYGAPLEQKAALLSLEGDVRLWRMVFSNAGTLVEAMILLAYLEADYLLLGDMIADDQTALPLTQSDVDLLLPDFDPRDWDLGRALAGEFHAMKQVLQQSQELASRFESTGTVIFRLWNRLGNHFFKVNATENLWAMERAREVRMAADPSKTYTLAPTYDSWLAEGPSLSWVWRLPLSYNPIGKLLVAISTPTYDEYPLRAWDGAALQRLVRAGYEIRRRQIAAASIPVFLHHHPEFSKHPVDGRPFLWDAKTGEIRLQPVAHYPSAMRLALPVWRPTGG